MRGVDPLGLEILADEAGQLVVAEAPGIRRASPLPRRRHEGRAGQAAALPQPPRDAHLGIGRRVGEDIQEIVDRDDPQPQHVDHRVASHRRISEGSSPNISDPGTIQSAPA